MIQETSYNCARFEDIRVMLVNMLVFRDIMLHNLVSSAQCFKGFGPTYQMTQCHITKTCILN